MSHTLIGIAIAAGDIAATLIIGKFLHQCRFYAVPRTLPMNTLPLRTRYKTARWLGYSAACALLFALRGRVSP
jgi:hypothetical protein